MRHPIKVAALVISASVIALLLLGATTARYQGVQNAGMTLRERAEQSGGRLTVTDNSYHAIHYADIRSMINDSETIVVGTTLRNECQLTPDDKNINTIYQVHIEEVLRGTVKVGQIITLSVPGGLKVFSSSAWTAVQVPDFRQLRNSKRYTFFLQRNPTNYSFTLTGGFQGAFELPNDGSDVKPTDLRANSVGGKLKDKRVSSFLNSIRPLLKN